METSPNTTYTSRCEWPLSGRIIPTLKKKVPTADYGTFICAKTFYCSEFFEGEMLIHAGLGLIDGQTILHNAHQRTGTDHKMVTSGK